jgi:ABC-2 type transport system permease protein
LPADGLNETSDQFEVFRFGPLLGALFAGLAGAPSITAEIRYGTIRPTFLVTPRRGRVLAAKIFASGLLGILMGLLAMTVAVIAGSAALAKCGIPIRLDTSDYVLLPVGAAAGAALWAAMALASARSSATKSRLSLPSSFGCSSSRIC